MATYMTYIYLICTYITLICDIYAFCVWAVSVCIYVSAFYPLLDGKMSTSFRAETE